MAQPTAGPHLSGRFIEAIVVKICDGSVANRPVYDVVGVNLDGELDVRGLWVGTGGEGAKQWLTYLAELKRPWRGRRAHRLLRRPQRYRRSHRGDLARGHPPTCVAHRNGRRCATPTATTGRR